MAGGSASTHDEPRRHALASVKLPTSSDDGMASGGRGADELVPGSVAGPDKAPCRISPESRRRGVPQGHSYHCSIVTSSQAYIDNEHATQDFSTSIGYLGDLAPPHTGGTQAVAHLLVIRCAKQQKC
jgi:hypothetical protein